MSEMILDGTGSGNKAKVDSNNRLQAKTVSIGVDKNANENGDAYNINTGLITLTNDSETPILYVKNNEERNLNIFSIAVGTYDATLSSGTANDVTIKIIRNPTAGTIVDTATAVDINSNRNYGSAGTLTADAYKGATGNTMTDGADHILFRHSDSSRLFASIDEVLPKGTSIGIKITPPTNNTSMQVYAALICHLKEAE